MGIKLQGGNNSSDLATVNSLQELQVVTPQPLAGFSAGFVQMSTEIDAGDQTGVRTVLPLELTDDYRLRVGLDQSVFNTTFEGTTIQTTHWLQLHQTMVAAQANGFLTLNSSLLTAASNAAYVRSWRQFPTYGTYPLYLDMWVREGNYTSTNSISEWGYVYSTFAITQQLVEGICFRRTSGGQLRAAIVNAGIDIKEIAIDTQNIPARNGIGSYDPTESNHYLITFHNDNVRFWINDVLAAEVLCPSAQALFSASCNLPVGFRVLNTALSSAGRQLSVGFVNVGFGDQNTNKPWAHALCGMGSGAYQTQVGSTPGPTVPRGGGVLGHPTNAVPRTTAVWVNNTGPSLNSLGGLWTSGSLSSLVRDSDYPIFAYLNPAGTATQPGKTLYITGVRIGDTSVVTAPGAASSIFFSYIVQVDNNTSNTSTADGFSLITNTSGKSITIGGQGFGTSATDPVGTMKPGFDMTFNPPLVISSGKYCTVIVRPYMDSTAGNTLIVTGSVAFNGYFE